MCDGFGLIVTREREYFIEPDQDGDVSHSDILKRLGWKENKDPFTRHFVRVEYAEWTAASFRLDEQGTLPGWCDEQDIRDRCDRILAKVTPAWAECQKVRDPAYAEYVKVSAPALAEYKKVRAPALAEYEKVRDQAWAKYEKVRDQALAEYQKVRDPAYAEYVKVSAQAWAEYEKVRDQALAEYEKVRDPALAEYQKVRDPAYAGLKDAMKLITGYVPEGGERCVTALD